MESSLDRLQTDYLDLIQCHIDYREPHMEIFVEGFQKLQAQGKVRAYGLSTSDYDYLQAFNADNKAATLQIDYSILNRTPEAEIFPYITEHNLGVLTRGPLAMGILTGKFTAESTFGPGDFRQNWVKNPEEHEIFLSDLAKVERSEGAGRGSHPGAYRDPIRDAKTRPSPWQFPVRNGCHSSRRT